MYPDPEGRQCQSKLQKIKRLQFQNCSPGPRRGAVDQLKLQKFRRLQFQNCRPEREAVPTQDTKNRHTTSELRIQGSEGPYKLSKYCHTPSLYSIGLIRKFCQCSTPHRTIEGCEGPYKSSTVRFIPLNCAKSWPMPWQLKPGPNKGRFETTSCRAARSKKIIHFSKKIAKLDYLPPLRVEGVVNPISVEIGLAQFVWMKNWINLPPLLVAGPVNPVLHPHKLG